jgi:hypothetical protein
MSLPGADPECDASVMSRRNVQADAAQAAQRAAAAGHPAGSALKSPQSPAAPTRSCCCPARPQVKVIMPATAARPHPVDLWLCGHHYRIAQAALTQAGAGVQTVGHDASDWLATAALTHSAPD